MISISNLNRYVTFDDGLAAEPRMQRDAIGHVDAVFLVFVHLCEIGFTLLADDVTGGAGAIAAARVLKLDAIVERNIEQRTFPAMLVIRRRAGLVIDGHG